MSNTALHSTSISGGAVIVRAPRLSRAVGSALLSSLWGMVESEGAWGMFVGRVLGILGVMNRSKGRVGCGVSSRVGLFMFILGGEGMGKD